MSYTSDSDDYVSPYLRRPLRSEAEILEQRVAKRGAAGGVDDHVAGIARRTPASDDAGWTAKSRYNELRRARRANDYEAGLPGPAAPPCATDEQRDRQPVLKPGPALHPTRTTSEE